MNHSIGSTGTMLTVIPTNSLLGQHFGRRLTANKTLGYKANHQMYQPLGSQHRRAHRLSVHVRLGRLTHANSAFCSYRKQLLVQRKLVSARMFIVYMGTVNCSYREYWHPSVSFVIIINKQVPAAERRHSFLHNGT